MLTQFKHLIPGHGGDCVLILGTKKTALIDTAMAYCGENLVRLLEEALAGRPLDYVFLSHSHYDHAGGVPALRRRWPLLTVAASPHARDIFLRQGAQKVIGELSVKAGELYEGEGFSLPAYGMQGLSVDLSLSEGDVVSLGDMELHIMETPGHTHCSLSFFVPQRQVLFPCESIGVFGEGCQMEAPFLTSFQETLTSIERCRELEPTHLFSPHYGLVEEVSASQYFDLAQERAYLVRDFILERLKRGESHEEILSQCIAAFWDSRGETKEEQPLGAFSINMRATMRVVEREFL